MFDQVVVDIKKGNIQGSENLAKWCLKAFSEKKDELDESCHFLSTYLTNLEKSRKILLDLISNDPVVVNVLDYVFPKEMLGDMQSIKEISREIGNRITIIEKHLEKLYIRVGRIGSAKIKNGMVVYTHGYSSTVLKVLEVARRKKIIVNVTEAKPSGSGRKMAEDLAKLGIPVNFFVDSAIRQAIKTSDLVLLGCEAAYKGRFFASMGSEVSAEVAKDYKIPLYICTDTLKNTNDFRIESSMDFSGVWPNAPAKINVQNLLFEKVKPTLVTAVICEDGILPPQDFLKLKFPL